MASTTKIMTALLLCELGGDLSKEIVTTREMVTVEGSSMGLQVGDRVSYHDLLYGMMLSSGNDAANTVALSLGGSVSGFARLMNERAKRMGLENTHFVTPSGLDAEGHYTTAYELALITKEALANEQFAIAAAAKTVRLKYGNPPYNRTLTNHNKLLKMYDDVVGVKTGFTSKSGRCLVSASRKDGKLVIAVTLNDKNDWQDHRNLLDLGLSLIESKIISPKKSDYSVEVTNGEKIEVTIPAATISVTEKTRLSCLIKLPQFIYAPVKQGDKIGSVGYYCNDNLVCELPLTADRDVEYKQSELVLFFETFKNLLLNI